MRRASTPWGARAADGFLAGRRSAMADLAAVVHVPPGASLRAAVASVRAGGLVELGPHEYVLREPLIVNKACTIRGAGNATLIRCIGLVGAVVASVNDVRVQGLRLLSVNGGVNVGVSVQGDRCSVADLEIDGFDYGILVLDAASFEIRGNRIRNRNTYGILATISGAPTGVPTVGADQGYWTSATQLGRIVDNEVEESQVYAVGHGTWGIRLGAGVCRTVVSGNNCWWSEIEVTNSSGVPALPSYGNAVDTGDNVANAITVL